MEVCQVPFLKSLEILIYSGAPKTSTYPSDVE